MDQFDRYLAHHKSWCGLLCLPLQLPDSAFGLRKFIDKSREESGEIPKIPVEFPKELLQKLQKLGVSEYTVVQAYIHDIGELVVKLFLQGDYLSQGKIRMKGKRHEQEGVCA